MALPPSDPKRHRRRQLRRALIGWLGGFAIIALIVVAAIAGGDEKEEVVTVPVHSGGVLDFHMTTAEYQGLHEGEAQSSVLSELGRVGLPESQTPTPIITLFPSHDDHVTCSYWQIVDAPETAARLCFSTPGGVLEQKLERVLELGFEGEQTVQA